MYNFTDRHIGINNQDKISMLEYINSKSIEQLISETIPENIRLKKEMNLKPALSENDYLSHIEKLGKKNKIFKSYIGLGYNQAIVPSVIKRNILENPSWYTAYTPYQAEIAQGRMEALLNYQTIICDLTGMQLANASLLDESTAAAEAMTMLFSLRNREQKKNNISRFFVSKNTLPQTISLLETRAEPLGIQVIIGDFENFNYDSSFYGCLMQYPGVYGEIEDIEGYCSKAKNNNIKIVVAADLFSLCLLKKPSLFGADVVVGTSQRFGIPLGYGGPHAAYFATKEEYKRSVPGRIIGLTKDSDDDSALRMALQTREQHIKRDRATSNICTSQVLLAVMAGMYGVYHGPEGLRNIALRIHGHSLKFSSVLQELGYEVLNKTFFDTLHIRVKGNLKTIIQELSQEAQINVGYSEKGILVSMNEVMTNSDLDSLLSLFAKGKDLEVPDSYSKVSEALPKSLVRVSRFMEHPTFIKYRSETDMMRYMKKLERRDIALNMSLIHI